MHWKRAAAIQRARHTRLKRITAPEWAAGQPGRTSTHRSKSRSVHTASLILVNLIRILFYISFPSCLYSLYIYQSSFAFLYFYSRRELFLHFIRPHHLGYFFFSDPGNYNIPPALHSFFFFYFAEPSTIAEAKRKGTGFSFRFDTSLSSQEKNWSGIRRSSLLLALLPIRNGFLFPPIPPPFS